MTNVTRNNADSYETWLESAWGKSALAGIQEPGKRNKGGKPFYTEDALKDLVQKYKGLNGSSDESQRSLSRALDTILMPAIPKSHNGVGVYLREWPLPCAVAREDLAPEECGKAEVPSNIMSGAVERVIKNKKLYETMYGAMEAASTVSRHFGLHSESSWEGFARRAVVGDLVKVQALYCDMYGNAFTQELGKRSCHTRGMYEFAGRLLPNELKLLGVNFVVAFGNLDAWGPALKALELPGSGWQTHRPVNGKGKPIAPPVREAERILVLLPHPQAWGGALKKGVESVLSTSAFGPSLSRGRWYAGEKWPKELA